MSPTVDNLKNFFSLSQNSPLAEVGGGHGQKGVDFQRYWAILRIFELKEDAAGGFLIIFEAVQDIAEFDSEISPSRVDLYQIKKRDSGEWSFNELTGLLKPDGRKKKLAPVAAKVEQSPLGKLYKACMSLQYLDTMVHFVSNAGCDLPLEKKNASASSSLKCLASDLDAAHVSSLLEGLALLHGAPAQPPDLKRLTLTKTTLHPDNPDMLALGAAASYLSRHCPKSAGQAKAFVDALFARLSALGRKTEPVASFAELRRQRGYSMAEMDDALGDLKSMPDLKDLIESVLVGLVLQGLSPIYRVSITIGVAKYFSALVSNSWGAHDVALVDDCIIGARSLLDVDPLLPALENEAARLAAVHTTFKKAEVFAYLLIQVTKDAAS